MAAKKKPFDVLAEGLLSEKVGVAGFEPTTSCAQGREQPQEKSENQGISATSTITAYENLTSASATDSGSSVNLASLLAQLAALPPEQRAALAALLAPAAVAVPQSSDLVRSNLSDRCPLDSMSKREGSE